MTSIKPELRGLKNSTRWEARKRWGEKTEAEDCSFVDIEQQGKMKRHKQHRPPGAGLPASRVSGHLCLTLDS